MAAHASYATKSDVHAVRDELHVVRDDLSQKIDTVRDDLTQKIDAARDETRAVGVMLERLDSKVDAFIEDVMREVARKRK